jgi:methanogenic corrinoid protein MtbC1
VAKLVKKLGGSHRPAPQSRLNLVRSSIDAGSASTSDRELGFNSESDLLVTIRDRVVPQLMLAHAEDAAVLGACPNARLPPTRAEVESFASIAVAEDLEAALRFIETLADGGLSVEVILLDLVAPAARLLGDQWLDDRRSLTEVTVGLTLLHRVVHVLGPSAAGPASDRGSVVLVAAPREQHTLGIFLLAEFLRKERWGVRVDPNMPLSDLLDLLRREHVDMVGISVSNTDLVEPLTRMVAAVRGASVNERVIVMIGGSLALANQSEEIGATFSNDPREAVALLARHATVRPR